MKKASHRTSKKNQFILATLSQDKKDLKGKNFLSF